VTTAFVSRRPQGDGYRKSIREICVIRSYLFQNDFGKLWKIDALAESFRMAHVCRDAFADLQWRDGYQ
jgi:hypothetical protein